MLSVVPGKRTTENTEKVVDEFRERTGGRPMNLILILDSNEYAPYKGAILDAYGKEVTPPPTGKPGRPKNPYKVPPSDLNYATVHKTREKGRLITLAERPRHASVWRSFGHCDQRPWRSRS